MTAWIFSFVFPFLLTTVLLQELGRRAPRPLRGRVPGLVAPFIAAAVIGVPVGGLPLARWVISFNANFSIPLTAILLSRAVGNAFGVRLLDDRAILTCWIFSLIAAAALYPMALGLTRWDPYSAGWGFSWLFVLSFLLTIVLLSLKNRFAIVLMGAILAYDLGLLESTNLWDYLMDPFMALVSVVGMGWLFGPGRRPRGAAGRANGETDTGWDRDE